MRKQAAFLFKPAPKLSVRQRIQQAHHANRDRRLFDHIDHRISRRLGFAVEANDEARGNEKTGGVDGVNALRNAATRVLLLAHRDQSSGIGTLDADKHTDEIGARHQLQQFRVVGEIDRCFRCELERKIARFQPPCQFWKERLDSFLVADEVVVHEVDMAAIAQAIEFIELCEHLGIGLGARYPPVELYDVAELAGKWTAARELYADMEIVVEFQEIEARDRRLGHIGLKFFRLELPLARARFPGLNEIVDDVFGLAHDAKIGGQIEMGTRCDSGAANDHWLPAGMAEIHNIKSVALLR